MVSGFAAGIAGAFYASYISYIEPSSFSIGESLGLLAMVIVGGPGTHWGPMKGAAILVLLPELLRFVGVPESVQGPAQTTLFGLVLTAFLMWRISKDRSSLPALGR